MSTQPMTFDEFKWPHPCDDRKIAEIVKSVQDTRTWDGTVTVRK